MTKDIYINGCRHNKHSQHWWEFIKSKVENLPNMRNIASDRTVHKSRKEWNIPNPYYGIARIMPCTNRI